jgi:hypothetical protein
MMTDLHKWLKRYPFSYFVKDPPILVEDPSAWGLNPQGISYIESGGYWHALDWIGANNYPNVADILEELLNGWCSGLLPLTDKEHIRLLVPHQSRRLLFHPHGWIENFKVYRDAWVDDGKRDVCLLPDNDPRREEHIRGEDMCAALHWQVVEGGKLGSGRFTTRKIGDCTYEAIAPMKGEPPIYKLAHIMWLPIDEIHVIDSEAEKDKDPVFEALDFLAGLNSIPVFVVNN